MLKSFPISVSLGEGIFCSNGLNKNRKPLRVHVCTGNLICATRMECAQRRARLQAARRRTSDRVSFVGCCVSFVRFHFEFSVHFNFPICVEARGYNCWSASYVIPAWIFAAVWYKSDCDPLQHLTRNKTHVTQGFCKSTFPYLFQWRPLLFRGSKAFAVETHVNYWYKIQTCDVIKQIHHCVKSDYYPSAPE